MSQRIYTVGTSPVLLARDNPNRASIGVSMPPTSVVAANTGIVYVGKGFPPVATVGAPNSGDPINQGTQLQETAGFSGDPTLFRGQLWAVSDTAGQQVVVDETYNQGQGL